MILIFNNSFNDESTYEVMDWIHSLGGQCFKVRDCEFQSEVEVSINYAGRDISFELSREGQNVHSSEINAVWFRRWYSNNESGDLSFIRDSAMRNKIAVIKKAEFRGFTKTLFASLDAAKWLSKQTHFDKYLNKFEQINVAAHIGLEYPNSIITNRKTEVVGFQQKVGTVVTKNLGNVDDFRLDGEPYSLYTSEVTEEMLEYLPDTFPMAQFQEAIPKDFEIRVFYLNGELYSMAIFSQEQGQTSVDFRKYNFKRMNRMTPYKLPTYVAALVVEFMNKIGLETGSLDIIKAKDGRFVFLEVNPVGQFGMVSKNCNYPLERELAYTLIDMDKKTPNV